ncbi:MAG TPA: DsbA family protein [Longimicrobiales bacterium]|nr:DsbA family protein [Longimicrobiales bacterium]
MTEPAGGSSADLIVYADYVCPFCYLGEVAIAPLREEGVRIENRPFELRPAPTPLPDMDEPRYRDSWEQSVLPLAAALGAPAMKRPTVSTRTRKAHEAAAFAREHGAGDAMHRAIYEAYFLEQRDIGRVDVLVEIGASVGLDRMALKIALDIDRYTDEVVAHEVEAARIGITAVPAHLAAGADGRYRLMMGVRPTDDVRALLAAGSLARDSGDDE